MRVNDITNRWIYATLLEGVLEDQDPSSQEVHSILAQAIQLDQGRPNDDMSLVVVASPGE